jgi:hypothetical protein
MKYRILTNEELSHLGEDFKHFLIVNGVHAEEWEQLNITDIPKAVQLVELFSDAVLQKVYQKIGYLEFRSSDSCLVFQVGTDKMKLITIQKNENSSVDLSTVESIHHALVNSVNQLTFFRSEKEYSNNRETEIHKLIEDGCFISTLEFWNLLNEVLS